MNLTAEQLQENYEKFLSYIDTYIKGERAAQVKKLYTDHAERIMLMPASSIDHHHNAYIGGYVDHVNRVVKGALAMSAVWEGFGCNMTTFTQEELVFSAINHDLGKMGSDTEEAYIPQTDNWRRDKLGEDYMFNDKLPFASVPDRGLYLLQAHDIKYTFN